ncbi:MAG: F0F1 ATP synthase subunit A [Acidimicrobiia bacterium]|nr:F0F1 ATP synthase subunit A [Acidimicrobiia bacterium]MDH5616798.1 F0F1 ATP synthase subunit A [Acidimicrobiia bacterium]
MDGLILASECDVANEVICAPANVNELFFNSHAWFTVGGLAFTRTSFLIFLAAALSVGFLFFSLRKGSLVPGRLQTMGEGVVGFVRDDLGRSIIGPEGDRYLPYLLSLFIFILIGNLFEVTPLVNFPITSRMAIPLFLSLVTYVIFVVVGFKKNGFRYVFDIAWPKSVPVALRPLVGLIELVSTFALRPITLAVRLFANLVAGHLMLTLLLGSGVIFVAAIGDIGAKAGLGVIWFAVGMGIFVFEIVVAILQAYIFVLLSAVYIQSSVHPEH